MIFPLSLSKNVQVHMFFVFDFSACNFFAKKIDNEYIALLLIP